MDRSARLIQVTRPRKANGVVLVLHGGAAQRGDPPVSASQPPVLLMIPVARRIGRAGHGQLAVYRLLNSHRGWNREQSPVEDVRWALSQVYSDHGEVPVALVGHSIGGRAALLGAAEPGVVSAVALAPWVYPSDDAQLPGRRILIVHGSRDRIADPDRSAAVARNLASTAESLSYVRVRDGRHALLRQSRLVTGLAAGFVATTLLGQPARGLVAAALNGQPDLEI
jgi:alpha-beta hydrolase superfamily lysophospholipase